MKPLKAAAKCFAVSLLLPSLALAQEAPSTGQQLNDQALALTLANGFSSIDRPTTRGDSTVPVPTVNLTAGGIIAGEDTQISTTMENEVSLNNSAQENARGVNLVNNSGTIVDNAINIWSGDYNQRTASDLVPLTLVSDVLGEQINIVVQSDGNSATVGNFNDYDSAVNTRSSSSSSFLGNASVTAGTDSVEILDGLLYDSNESVGRGVAATAGANLHVDAGEVTIGGDITTQAGVAWGLLSGETSMGAEVTVELPELDIGFEGTACAALDGASCSSSSESSDSSTSEETLAAVLRDELTGAQASIIAKDGAEVTTSENNLVVLNDNAQTNATGVNIINTSGGMIGNGINISRTDGMSVMAGSVSTIRQSNVMIQSR